MGWAIRHSCGEKSGVTLPAPPPNPPAAGAPPGRGLPPRDGAAARPPARPPSSSSSSSRPRGPQGCESPGRVAGGVAAPSRRALPRSPPSAPPHLAELLALGELLEGVALVALGAGIKSRGRRRRHPRRGRRGGHGRAEGGEEGGAGARAGARAGAAAPAAAAGGAERSRAALRRRRRPRPRAEPAPPSRVPLVSVSASASPRAPRPSLRPGLGLRRQPITASRQTCLQNSPPNSRPRRPRRRQSRGGRPRPAPGGRLGGVAAAAPIGPPRAASASPLVEAWRGSL